MTRDEQRTADERVARAICGRIIGDLERLLGAYQHLDGAHGPKFLRHVCVTAQVTVLGTALAELVATDGDQGRGVALEAMADLEDHLKPIIATDGRSALLH